MEESATAVDNVSLLAVAMCQLQQWQAVSSEPILHRAIVDAEDEDDRILTVAAKLFDKLGSKSQAEKAAKRGSLFLNGETFETSRRVHAGDELSLQEAAEAALTPKYLNAIGRFVVHLRSQGLRVPFEDDECAVVFKPPGVHTKAGSNHKYAALEDAVSLGMALNAIDAYGQDACARLNDANFAILQMPKLA